MSNKSEGRILASWNELFADEKNRELIPETAV